MADRRLETLLDAVRRKAGNAPRRKRVEFLLRVVVIDGKISRESRIEPPWEFPLDGEAEQTDNPSEVRE